MSRISKAAAVVAGTGAVVLGGAGFAVADAGADAAAIGSPGVGSGNVAQAPIHVPVNFCGNTVNVIGALNPAFGNTCVNTDQGAHADAAAIGSPGVGSGNVAQAPIHVPVNFCGNTGNLIGALNPSFGNNCLNGSGDAAGGGDTGSGDGSGEPGTGSGDGLGEPGTGSGDSGTGMGDIPSGLGDIVDGYGAGDLVDGYGG
ncbi:chaplin [Streptomyces sp. NPDC050145]|uniref:chaplin n=1 Tax=Streptomyces sp. NPDC050145 TaxID=3365602 RepID=UPI00378B034A